MAAECAAISGICSHQQNLQPSAESAAISRICSHQRNLQPSAESAAISGICSHQQNLQPSAESAANSKISNKIHRLLLTLASKLLVYSSTSYFRPNELLLNKPIIARIFIITDM